MNGNALSTPVVHANADLFALLKSALPATLPEGTLLAITSKIVALAEGSVAEKKTGGRVEKHRLVMQEADAYIPAQYSQYGVMLTIKDSVLAVNAGIDESNADGTYVLWPKDSFAVAEKVWEWLKTEYGLRQRGVIITDSKTIPLRWGTIGTCLAYCGFKPLINKIGEKDLFGHEMQMTQVNVAEALAVTAVVLMGEVAESTPLALLHDIPQVVFTTEPPTEAEKESLCISLEDDVYSPLLTSAPWKKKK